MGSRGRKVGTLLLPTGVPGMRFFYVLKLNLFSNEFTTWALCVIDHEISIAGDSVTTEVGGSVDELFFLCVGRFPKINLKVKPEFFVKIICARLQKRFSFRLWLGSSAFFLWCWFYWIKLIGKVSQMVPPMPHMSNFQPIFLDFWYLLTGSSGRLWFEQYISFVLFGKPAWF